MLLFFILFIFFILHIQFLLQNILLGLDKLSYFEFTIKYGFDREVAIQSLFFSIACAFGFAVCYKMFYRKRRRVSVDTKGDVNFKFLRGELLSLNIIGIILIAYMLIVVELAGFDYNAMTQIREVSGFIFELRMIFLLLLSHILLNLPWRKVFLLRKLKYSRIIVFIYFICTLLFQARSATFEIVAVVAFAYLMWVGDRVKLKYIVIVFVAMLVPNLIVLGRLGVPENIEDLIRGIFSFEYSIIINNFLSAAIVSGINEVNEFTFTSSLLLLIPSPLRDLLGVFVVKSDYYGVIASAAEVSGGGFSLLAEMFSNFGWYAPLVFGAIGILLGRMFSRAARVGNVDLISATAPLLYVAFVLAFRNDFGVFLKYVVQLFLIAFLFNFALKLRLGK